MLNILIVDDEQKIDETKADIENELKNAITVI